MKKVDIKITPKRLKGTINIPPSKSISHRALIAAALADGESRIYNLLDCVDITDATIKALRALGADISICDNYTKVTGISSAPKKAEIDCQESGSTLRFIIPIASALGCDTTYFGRGKLPERPITPYLDEFPKHGVWFLSDKMPYITQGKLKGGIYEIAGNISSQFITGFLFALSLLENDSVIKITTKLESKPYIDLTIDAMKSFGIEIIEKGNEYRIKGGQKYIPTDYTVEADMSQAAFFLVADAIGGSLEINGLNPDSKQGDKAIIEIVKCYGEKKKPFDIDASQIPDLVPILTVLATFANGKSRIRGCERLRIKECDRLAAISEELNRLGAKITIKNDALIIEGVNALKSGVCDCWNDHRIAMALSVAAQRAEGEIILKGAECVSKSYPTFFEDYKMLGGIADVI